MTERLLSLVLLLTLALAAPAQKPKNNCRFSPDEFKANLEQFITQHACLTPQEAAKFFPVFNEMKQKQRALHDEMRNYKRIKPCSDSECKRYVEKMDDIEIEMKQIQRKYHDKFMQILPPCKVFDIINAEDKYYRQTFKRMADKKHHK